MAKPTDNAIEVSHLTMGYDGRTIMRDISFDVRKGEAFLVIGPSGCGKSTLLRHLVGLAEPVEGRIRLLGEEFLDMDFASRQRFMRRIGILYQAGALWSSMTIAENDAVQVVCDDDQRGAEGVPEFHDEPVEVSCGDGVQSGAWLVEEEDFRVECQRPCQSCALLHSA